MIKQQFWKTDENGNLIFSETDVKITKQKYSSNTKIKMTRSLQGLLYLYYIQYLLLTKNRKMSQLWHIETFFDFLLIKKNTAKNTTKAVNSP